MRDSKTDKSKNKKKTDTCSITEEAEMLLNILTLI